MAAGRRSKISSTTPRDAGRVGALGAERLDQQGDRSGHADRVGHLELAAGRRAGGDQVLGHPACRVGSRAIDLGGVLPGEGAAAVACHPAVGVDDDLAPGETGVGVGTALLEDPGRVGQDPECRAVELGGEQRLDDVVPQVGQEEGLEVDARIVLGRDEHGLERDRPPVLVADAHLGLAVGAQVGQRADRGAPGPGAVPAGGRATPAAASDRGSRRRRSRTSSPGPRRPAR